MKCKKCGTVLAERNYESGLCDYCKQNTIQNTIFNCIKDNIGFTLFITVFICLLVFACIYNEKHPVYYEEELVQIDHMAQYRYSRWTGKAAINSYICYIYFNCTMGDNIKLRVSSQIYDKYKTGDYFMITYKMRDGNIEKIQYKEY